MIMKYLLFIGLFFVVQNLYAQDELLKLLESEEVEVVDYVSASFKTTRVINNHSLENCGPGVLDMKISHRFNSIEKGAYDLFGLDGATIRLGLDFGITDRLMLGFGRSTLEKTYDGFVKYKLLRQSTGAKTMPVTLIYLVGTSINTLKWEFPERKNYFTSRLSYVHQIILGRKYSADFTLQVMPTLVHRNLVADTIVKNDVWSVGVAGRQKLNKRLALNAEYHFVLPDQIGESMRNSFSLGIDIETGGHVFQLHFTNSRSMVEKAFITETSSRWLDGHTYFGFNVSRVFTVSRKKSSTH